MERVHCSYNFVTTTRGIHVRKAFSDKQASALWHTELPPYQL